MFQPQDENAGALFVSVLILLVSLVLIAGGLLLFHDYLVGEDRALERPHLLAPPPSTQDAAIEPIGERAALEQSREDQLEHLNSPPSWVNREKGTVRIPIRKAMETLADVGELPEATSTRGEGD
jgi:hypothetical protein